MIKLRLCTKDLWMIGVFALGALAPLHMEADDPLDQSKSAAATWQRSQVGKMGPFLDDPYLVVPLDIPSQALTHQTAAVKDSLASFTLKQDPGNHVQILADGRYVLYGDLFKTGETYALVELPVSLETDPYWNDGRLAFARLVKGEWELRGLWDISTTWRPKGWQKTDADYLPLTPAEAPFFLQDFDGDGVPEVIMAGEVSKYFQNYYLLRFDAQTQTLHLLANSMGKPELVDGYLRLYFNSGHRSIFEEWVFAKLNDGKLRKVASWHNGTPYNPGDDEGLRVQALNEKGVLELFEIDEDGDKFEISREGIKLATIRFFRKALTPPEPQFDYEPLENSWLFHHLTGLPESIFPEIKNLAPLPPFSKYEEARLSGNLDFIKRLKSVTN